VLGLVTASTKSSFEAVDTTVKEAATKLLVIDRTLARYGPEAAALRAELKHVVAERIEMIWPTDAAQPMDLDPITAGRAKRVEGLVDAIRPHDASDPLQSALQGRAASLAEEVLEARWMAMAGAGSSVPLLFLVVVASWLTLIFLRSTAGSRTRARRRWSISSARFRSPAAQAGHRLTPCTFRK
jgi:hypothetical protein